MPQPNDLSRSLVALDQNSTIIAVVEMSQSSWLVGGILSGIGRQPRKKLEPSPERLLALDDAHARADGIIENGFVHLPETAPWLAEYLHELAVFPNGQHDDQAD
jgi:predicted phage terminase large subunit-like protein